MTTTDAQASLIFDLTAQSLRDPERYLYLNSARHHEIMAHIAESDPDHLLLQGRIIRYLQLYIDWSAEKSELMTDLPFEGEDYTFPGPRVREEFYGPEIDYINRVKINFDYSQEITAAIHNACDNLFDDLKTSGWIERANYFWDSADRDLRLSILNDFVRHFDQALGAAGIENIYIPVEPDDSGSEVLARLDQTEVSDSGSEISIRIHPDYLDEMRLETMLATVLHERIHGIFAAMTQRMYLQLRSGKYEVLPWDNDHEIAYLRRRNDISGGITRIMSVYLSDGEEQICFSCDYAFDKKIYNYLRHKNHAPQLPEAACAAPHMV